MLCLQAFKERIERWLSHAIESIRGSVMLGRVSIWM